MNRHLSAVPNLDSLKARMSQEAFHLQPEEQLRLLAQVAQFADPERRHLLEQLGRRLGLNEDRLLAILDLETLQDRLKALGLPRDRSPQRLQDEHIYPMNGWMGDYLAWAIPTSAPLAWHFWCAASLISAAARRNIWVDAGMDEPVYLANYYMLVGPSGCTSGDTEFLTPTGWKRIDEYKQGEVIGQWRNGKLEFVKPTNYIDKPAEKLLKFGQRNVSMVLSEDHRVLVSPRGRDGLEVRTAADVFASPKRCSIPVNFEPGVEDAPISDDLIRFAVAVNADGTFPKRRRKGLVIFALKKRRKVKRLRSLVKSLGIPCWERVLPCRPSYTCFNIDSDYLGKKFEGWHWWDLSKRQLEIVVEECKLWDGHRGSQDKFFSMHKGDADFIQYAAHATGGSATISQNDVGLWSVYFSNGRATHTLRNPRREYVKADRQFCFTVPSGFWVARHNNHIFVTGNSGKSTAIKKAKDILKRTNRRLLKIGREHPTFPHDPTIFVGPPSGTLEAWLDEMAAYYTDLVPGPGQGELEPTMILRPDYCCYIAQDEIVVLLGQDQHGAERWFNALFQFSDCPEEWRDSKVTAKREGHYREMYNVAVTTLFGSAPEHLVQRMSSAVFSGGYIGRTILSYRTHSGRVHSTRADTDPVLAEQLAEGLVRIAQRRPGRLALTEEARDWYDGFLSENHQLIRECDPKMVGAYERAGWHMVKTAGVMALAEDPEASQISLRLLQVAREIVEAERPGAERIVGGTRTSDPSEQLNALERAIGSPGQLDYPTILGRMRGSYQGEQRLQEALQSLLVAGKLRCYPPTQGSGVLFSVATWDPTTENSEED